MQLRRRHRHGKAAIEYVVLAVIVLGAVFAMSPVISRTFQGHWKRAGDSFAFGRQYEHGRTAECVYAQTKPDFGIWFDNNCYQGELVKSGPAPFPCKPGDLECEDLAKFNCGELSKSYCCENNTQPSGQSNCTTCMKIFCDAPKPSCEETTTGTDNCGNPCEKTGPPCVCTVFEDPWDIGGWNTCTASCGGDGVETRTVTCPPKKCCPEPKPETERPCSNPFTGTWNVAPGTCSASCGGSGTQTEVVTCSTSCCDPSTQPSPQTTPCERPFNGTWTVLPGTCTASCGGSGTQTETVNCSTSCCNPSTQPSPQTTPCAFPCASPNVCVNNQCITPCTPVNGNWTTWSCEACSASCGPGTRNCSRTCTNPAPACGGADCSGLDGGSGTKTEDCNNGACCVPDGTCHNCVDQKGSARDVVIASGWRCPSVSGRELTRYCFDTARPCGFDVDVLSSSCQDAGVTSCTGTLNCGGPCSVNCSTQPSISGGASCQQPSPDDPWACEAVPVTAFNCVGGGQGHCVCK